MTPHHLKNREVWGHGTSLSPPLFIEVSLTGQKNVQSSICMLGVSILPLFTILIFYFGILPTVSRECGIFRILPTVSRECGIFVSVFHFIT